MKILNYDADVDVLTIKFGGDVFESDELEPGIVVDYDTTGAVVSIEVMDLLKRIEIPSASKVVGKSKLAFADKPNQTTKGVKAANHRTPVSRGSQEKNAKPRSRG